MKILPILGATLIVAQGLLMLFAPQRFAAITRWNYRLIGARPAEPGRGTFLFYRILGAALCALIAFILITKFVPE
ncbi:hypothetical protein PIB19_14315 [Sphingomonas sp. 7/4-4]|uniref:hypothetical protein n=1 Tax=Sphingomonas sp. 7/4-4 TaxID=3018446 RepID=UPI0022F3B575|nr:hypothetical protein [Sphingomonas sp. 7/4-4]WBY06708.1 hypothetical protein PIB19_14315 [Sphingomonas sp. 7/4-4]